LTPVLFAISGRVFVVRAGTAEGRRFGSDGNGDVATNDVTAGDEEGHAVVVGCGPAGKRVVDAMVEAGTPVVIIELNTRLLDAPQDRVRVVYGDATLPEILEKARVPHAKVVVVTVPEPATVRRVVQNVRTHAIDTRIVARARYHLYLDQIRDAGADEVIDEESETGEELAGAALRATGALP
ncbi:MAG TPA: NAD(P)-binding protein, partial [Chloroflexota bacterium]|nr:NAD(P)-binding protein [Chloroflexota bacterium]